MSRASHPNSAEARKAAALERQATSNLLTPQQRLDKLNSLNLRAVKERRKLEKAIEKAKQEASKPKEKKAKA
jgi:hypothetical protein